jgi:hypothetical protein
MLAKQVNLFNIKARQIKDYEVDVKETGNKKIPYQIIMLTEEGNKHKFAGTSKECFNFLDSYINI